MKILPSIFASLLFLLAMALPQVSAAFEVELEGWIWSPTIGWISVNCSNTDACADNGGVDYAVEVDSVSGDLDGFAWSPNIGWIKFGGLSDFPTGNGTSPVNAQVSGSYPDFGNLTGWARACAGTVPGDCSSMDSRTDGWDGWIALSGTASDASPYGVLFDATGSTDPSFSWGSTNVGWMSWCGFTTLGDPYCLGYENDITIPGFTVTPVVDPDGDGLYDVTPVATVLGIPDGVDVTYQLFVDTVPVADGTLTGDSTGTNNLPALIISDVPFTAAELQLEIDMPDPAWSVTDSSGDPDVGVVTESNEVNRAATNMTDVVPPPPVITINIPEESLFIRRDESVEVEWEIESLMTVTCRLAGAGFSRTITVAGSGVPGGAIATESDTEEIDNVTSNATFEIACDDPDATRATSETVTVIPDSQER